MDNQKTQNLTLQGEDGGSRCFKKRSFKGNRLY